MNTALKILEDESPKDFFRTRRFPTGLPDGFSLSTCGESAGLYYKTFRIGCVFPVTSQDHTQALKWTLYASPGAGPSDALTGECQSMESCIRALVRSQNRRLQQHNAATLGQMEENEDPKSIFRRLGPPKSDSEYFNKSLMYAPSFVHVFAHNLWDTYGTLHHRLSVLIPQLKKYENLSCTAEHGAGAILTNFVAREIPIKMLSAAGYAREADAIENTPPVKNSADTIPVKDAIGAAIETVQRAGNTASALRMVLDNAEPAAHWFQKKDYHVVENFATNSVFHAKMPREALETLKKMLSVT